VFYRIRYGRHELSPGQREKLDHTLASSNRSSVRRNPMNLFFAQRRFVVAIALCMSLVAFASARAAESTTTTRKWQPVAPVDWSKVKLDDFSDDELDLPYFLHHFTSSPTPSRKPARRAGS
jgi:hypothetical protein